MDGGARRSTLSSNMAADKMLKEKLPKPAGAIAAAGTLAASLQQLVHTVNPAEQTCFLYE